MTSWRALLGLADLVAGAYLHTYVAQVEERLRHRRVVFDRLSELQGIAIAAREDVAEHPSVEELEAGRVAARQAIDEYAASPLAEVGGCEGGSSCSACEHADVCDVHNAYWRAVNLLYEGKERAQRLSRAVREYDEALTSMTRMISQRQGQKR